MSGTLDFGGQLLAFGEQRGRDCAIADPRDRTRPAAAVLRFCEGAVSTSGNSERSQSLEGPEPGRVGHLLDPRTGRSAPDFGSVTVCASNAMDADCLSTALFVLGPDAALQRGAELGVGVVVVEVLESDDESAPPTLRVRATPDLDDRLLPFAPAKRGHQEFPK